MRRETRSVERPDAANYTDGSQNPLIVLDNIEVKQMSDELTTFMLTSITGIAKEKRKSGTDTETVTEQTKCLLNTTGIEPLCGELTEIQTRSFVVNFDMKDHTDDCFIESDAIAEIKKHRDYIISAFMKRTQAVLALMRDGRRREAMKLLNRELGSHDKKRCNEYLSLMYLMAVAGPEEDVEKSLQTLNALFKAQIESLNSTGREIARESNPIAAALNTLFNAHKTAQELDEANRYKEGGSRISHLDGFTERYQARFEDENTLEPMTAGKLLTALKRIAREYGLQFPYKDGGTLARRILNDELVLRENGFSISRQYNSHRKVSIYHIKRDHSDTS